MSDKNELLNRIRLFERQEQLLQFPHFSNADALDVGLMIVHKAKSCGYPVAIDITICGSQVFGCALPGTTANNLRWIKRKVNTVYQVQKSTLHVGAILQRDGKDIEHDWHLPEIDYSYHGGAFPVFVKGTGFIGTICVSGLPQEQDHQLVVDTLCEYLGLSIN
ncbi:MAG: heme-degrading domain-containing protein [Eubacteriales bacterium]